MFSIYPSRFHERRTALLAPEMRGALVFAPPIACLAALLLSALSVNGQTDFAHRRALLPDPTVASILNEISGENTLSHAAMIGRYARYPGSTGFHHAVEYISSEAKAAGLQNVEIHHFPYSDVGWDVLEGNLKVVSHGEEKLADIHEVSLAVAQNSHDTDVTAELVDIGSGQSPEDFAGKDVSGKIVLTSSFPPRVQSEAIFKRNASGIVSFFRGDFFGLRTPETATTWGSLQWTGPAGQPGGFAFMISPQLGEELRNRLANKQKLVVHAHIRVQAREPAELEMITGVLPGQNIQDEDIVLSAHVDHPEPAANDNASGSAVLLEVARVLSTLRTQGKISPFRRNIRFWWVCELETTQAYLFRHPEEGKRILLNLNVDQAGGDRLGRNDFVLQAALRFTPSFLNALVEDFGEYAERNLAPVDHAPSSSFVAPSGTHEAFQMRVWRDEDEKPTTDSFAFLGLQIPGVNVSVPSFNFIHSSADEVRMLDPTQLKRTCYLVLGPTVFLATMRPEQGQALADVVFSFGSAQIAHHLGVASRWIVAADKENLAVSYALGIDRIRDAILYQQECLDSVKLLAEKQVAILTYLQGQRDALQRTEHIYEDLLRGEAQAHAALLQTPPPTISKLSPQEIHLARTKPEITSSHGPLDKGMWDYPVATYAEWYTKHLIDNRRTVLGIYRAVHVLYSDYTLAELLAFLEKLQKAGLIQLAPAKDDTPIQGGS